MKQYILVIRDNGETARLACESLEDAERWRQAFINYGQYQSVEIEMVDSLPV